LGWSDVFGKLTLKIKTNTIHGIVHAVVRPKKLIIDENPTLGTITSLFPFSFGIFFKRGIFSSVVEDLV